MDKSFSAFLSEPARKVAEVSWFRDECVLFANIALAEVKTGNGFGFTGAVFPPAWNARPGWVRFWFHVLQFPMRNAIATTPTMVDRNDKKSE